MSLEFRLPDDPGLPGDVFRADPELLRALVADYELELDGASPEMATFLFGVAPTRIFERVFSEAPKQLPGESYSWLLLLSGYYGGAWLRAKLRSAQPEGMLAKLGSPPTREALEGIASTARKGLGAALGSDADARAYVEAALPELIAGFGYNQGYLLEILEHPPSSVAAPDGFLIPGGALWCGYGNPRLDALAGLYDVSTRLAHPPTARWRAVGEAVQGTQPSEVERGRLVWSTGLSVQGFSQASYDRLLEVSSSFLEIVQATALTAARACAADDVDCARTAAFANGCVAPWLGSYALGLMDNRADARAEPPQPHFTWQHKGR